ncbi:MAG: hypothetical protein BMS9Abin37_0444 [Acidobacteriota bacterium]|nr:MAG: hypothetical protein BMS9Abin37_0444 [Acidobacteriota bacterium]
MANLELFNLFEDYEVPSVIGQMISDGRIVAMGLVES